MNDWRRIRTIALFGAGLEAEKFYCRYREKYNFLYVIDSYKTGTFHGLPIVTLEQSRIMQPIDLIVITPIESKYAISEKLYEKGYKYGDDYCFSEDIGKKICVMYGNCHFRYIEAELKCNRCFMSQYAIHYYYVFLGADEKLYIPTSDILAKCDLFISQDIRSGNKACIGGYEEMETFLSDDCIRIIVPNLYGTNLFYPQLDLRAGFDENLLDIHHIECRSDSRNIYSDIIMGIKGYRDVNLEKWIFAREDVQQIMNHIEKEEVYSKEIVVENFRNQINRLIEREKKCSFSISDFLLKNYKKEKLFFEPNHPTGVVFREKTKRILSKLNIEYLPHVQKIDEFDQFEVFIYECVAQGLGLEWREQFIKNCRCEYTLYNQPIDLEEYITQYKAWMLQI